MNIYYVYAYLRKSDNSPYYVGKGKGRRAYSKDHDITVPNDKTKIVFLHENLTESDAISLECQYIKQYGRKDNGTGILRNRTNGGEGTSGLCGKLHHLFGVPLSTTRKAHLSKINTGKTVPAEIRKKISETSKKNYTEERRQHLSKMMSGTGNPRYGVVISEKQKQAVREKVSIPIQCCQTKIVYSSVTKAAKELGLKQGDISNVLTGRQKTTKGFSFIYMAQ